MFVFHWEGWLKFKREMSISASPTYTQVRKKGGGSEGKGNKKEEFSKRAWKYIPHPHPGMLKCSLA